MKKLINLLCLSVFFISCGSEIDNYDLPSETLYGEIIDKNTGEPIQTAVYDCMIQLEDFTWSETPSPTSFTSKPDGTFTNTKVFEGKYKVTPKFGPFIPIEGKEVYISGNTHVSFEVEPYLNLEIVKFQHSGTKVTVDFKISSSNDKYKVLDAQIFVSYSQFVSDGSKVQELCKGVNLAGTSNHDIYSTTHRIEVEGLKSGRSYYFRAGAKVDDPISKKYNYSKVSEKITIP